MGISITAQSLSASDSQQSIPSFQDSIVIIIIVIVNNIIIIT